MKHHVAQVFRPEDFAVEIVRRFLIPILQGCVVALCICSPARAGGITLTPEAAHALELTYAGDPDAAIRAARAIQQAQPDNPVGYLLEGEAAWWKMYCAACEIKWGMLDAWKRGKRPEDAAYLALADKAVELARAQLAKSDTAEMHLYAGLGLALKARLYSLRDERRNVARAGVAARSEFLSALQLDPGMADASAGLGLYNYYVDTLSAIAKVLRFLMGIPGGNKEEGLRQVKIGVDRGAFFAVDARFYLAKNLRTYDRRYEEALSVAEPLAARYPHNAVFLLLLGNLNAEMGRNAKASEYFHAALASAESGPDAACAARVRDLAHSFLASIH
jgi:tetratricopeptide (TPR) repeat protein